MAVEDCLGGPPPPPTKEPALTSFILDTGASANPNGADASSTISESDPVVNVTGVSAAVHFPGTLGGTSLFSSAILGSDIVVTVTVPDDSYLVQIHLMENTVQQEGERTFTVRLGDQVVASQLDLVKVYGFQVDRSRAGLVHMDVH